MNTKTYGISSGLVAVAWMDYSCDPLVRLSDAEAIIAEKAAEIAAWKNDAINGGNAGYLREVAEHQAERIKELAKELGIEHDLANRFGFENNDLRSKVAKQSAALKLARDALTDWLTTDLDEQQCWEALAAIDALGDMK